MTGKSRRGRKIAVIALLLAVTAVIFLAADSERPRGDIEWLLAPPASRTPRLAFLGRWMWPVRTQLQRIKYRFTGPPTLVTVDGTFLQLDSATLTAWTNDLRGFTNGSSVRAFVIDTEESLRRLMPLVQGEQISRPRITVADAQSAQMSVTESIVLGTSTNARTVNAGFSLDVLPRVRAHSVDLTCFFTSTECLVAKAARTLDPSLQPSPLVGTNAFFGARVQIPEKGSLFLLSNVTNAGGKAIGVVLTPTVARPPRK